MAFLLPLLALFMPAPTTAAPPEYALQARQIAADTYLVEGKTEDFSPANGGHIVNVAFIVTDDGVLLIDSGPSKRFGQALRALIAGITEQPVREIWLTHHHPDHAFGTQGLAPARLGALPATIDGLRADGEAFAANLYRMIGDWAAGTEVRLPDHPLPAGERQFGHHHLRLLALDGHTAGDLAVFDQTTGVLFAGDLLFHQRAPTTPHADPGRWLAALDVLQALPARVVVPGHGPAAEGPTREAPFEQTRAWLRWLDQQLRRAAELGLTAAEVLAVPLPPELAALPLARQELTRSLAHLYRRLEEEALRRER